MKKFLFTCNYITAHRIYNTYDVCDIKDDVVIGKKGRPLFDVDSNLARRFGKVFEEKDIYEIEGCNMGFEINTKGILERWENNIKIRAGVLNQEPQFIIVKVGDRNDSNLYVNNKIKKAKELGIVPYLVNLNPDITQSNLNIAMSQIDRPAILQLPLPEHLDAMEALSHLTPQYDMDGLTSYQKGLLVGGDPRAMIPATAKGVVEILKSLTDLTGLRVLIISRSDLIGRPLIQLMLQEDAVPIVAHSRVPKLTLYSEMKKADVIITGCGKRKIFNSNHLAEGNQIIIDCSMEKVDNIDNVGDMDKEDILLNTYSSIASGYGHTGPATILGLLDNVVKYYEMR